MRRSLSVLLVLVLALTLAPWALPVQAATSVTVLVYMNGSDLETEDGSATFNLEQMIDAKYSENVQVLVQTGGTRSWQNRYIDGKKNQRFALREKSFELLEESTRESMGNPDTLAEFITWGVAQAPADRYILLFWNHGHGPIGGFGLDQYSRSGVGLYSGDTLTLEEMALAFAKANTQFDLIGFDSCLMGCLEVAQVCAPYGAYLVASESLVPGYGWEYESMLNALARDPAIETAALGQLIADGFYKQSKKMREDSYVTLSVIRLDAIPAVTQALDQLVLRVDQEFQAEPEQFYAFAQNALRSTAFGGLTEEEGYTDVVDLDDLAQKLAGDFPREAAALRSAVAEAVAYQVAGWEYQQASGLAVYLPLRDKEFFYESLEIYETTQASEIYKLFVSAFALGLLNPRSMEGGVLRAYQDGAPETPSAVTTASPGGLYSLLKPGTAKPISSPTPTVAPQNTARPTGGSYVIQGTKPTATQGSSGTVLRETAAPSWQAVEQGWAALLAGGQSYAETQFFTSKVWLDEEEGYCHVSLDPQLLHRVDLIYYTLATPYTDGKLLLLGQDINLTINERTGDVQEWFEGYWFALDGHFVMPEVLDDTEEYIRYAIPVLLDGRLTSIHAAYSWEEGTYEILGVRTGLSTGDHDASRVMGSLEAGQTITPLFRLYDLETKTSELVEGQPFVLETGFSLEDIEVMDGEYALLFVVRDVLQNLHYTEYYYWYY